jgi:hypothetical protein
VEAEHLSAEADKLTAELKRRHQKPKPGLSPPLLVTTLPLCPAPLHKPFCACVAFCVRIHQPMMPDDGQGTYPRQRPWP